MISDINSVEIRKFQFPIDLVWEITNKCISNCMYCSGAFPEKQGNHFEGWCRAIQEKDDMYVWGKLYK